MSNSKKYTVRIGTTAALVCGICACMHTLVNRGNQASLNTTCRSNMYQIAVALSQYRESYGDYPPVYFVWGDAKSRHSWRILILPFLGEEGRRAHEFYNFNEPWDSENNRSLLRLEVSRLFRCPSESRRDVSSYVAVFKRDNEWVDQANNGGSMFLLEVPDSDILWTEPRDTRPRALNARRSHTPGNNLLSVESRMFGEDGGR